MYKKILHGLDGSEGSFKALDKAIELAKLYNAELHTLSVEELPRYAETIGEIVEEQEAANGIFKDALGRASALAEKNGLKIKSHVVIGHEVKSFIEFIKYHNFDLLVIGFMGHSALYDRVMGSTCQSLVRLALCSVLVVK